MDLISELSTLSTIPEATLTKLLEKVFYIISDEIMEAKIQEQEIVDIDIGIGSLKILLNPETIKYKFIPNAKLEVQTKAALTKEKNTLDLALEKSLVSKLTNIYKDFL